MRAWLVGLWLLLAAAGCAQNLDARNHFKIAHSEFQRGDYQKALTTLEGVVKAEPHYSDAYYLMGLCYIGLKDYPKAQEKLEQTIQMEPQFFPAYQQLGNLLLVQKKFAEAKTHFQKMSTVPKAAPVAQFCLGVVAYAQQDLKEAEVAWREALRLDPTRASARNNLGILKQNEGRHKEALSDFLDAVRIDHENPKFVLNVGWEYMELGDKVAARQQFDRVQRMAKPTQDRDLAIGYLAVACEAWMDGKWDKVANSCDACLKHNPDETPAMLLKARALEQQKDLAGARQAYQDALDSDPNVNEARKALERLPKPSATPSPAPDKTPPPADKTPSGKTPAPDQTPATK